MPIRNVFSIQLSFCFYPFCYFSLYLVSCLCLFDTLKDIWMVSCQKGPTHHAYAWQIGPFWQDTLDLWYQEFSGMICIMFCLILRTIVGHCGTDGLYESWCDVIVLILTDVAWGHGMLGRGGVYFRSKIKQTVVYPINGSIMDNSLYNYIYAPRCSHISKCIGTQTLDLYRVLVNLPDSKVHGANMGPTWVLSTPGGSHAGPMNLVIWAGIHIPLTCQTPHVVQCPSVLPRDTKLLAIGHKCLLH